MRRQLSKTPWQNILMPPHCTVYPLIALDPTKLKARQFARTAAPAKKVDNSLWTETPAERQQRLADEVSGKKKRASNADSNNAEEEALEVRKKRRIDEEIRRGVEEHTVNSQSPTVSFLSR